MKWGLAFVLALCAVVLWPGIRAVGPIDSREATDLEVAREALSYHEPLTPLFGIEPRFEKPLLGYLPDIVATWLHGNPVTNSRLWRIAVAVVLVLLTAAIGARHLGGRAGICAAAVLASSLGLVLAARVDGTQLVATLLGWVAAAAFADAWFGRTAGREGRLLIGYVALASVFVIAGPLPASWPFAAAAIYLALTKRPHGWRDLHVIPGIGIVVGIALPWYGAMIDRHGGVFLRHVPLFPYALGPRLSWVLGPFLALSFVVVGMFPWSALLPGAFQHAATWWRRVRPNALGTGTDPTNVVRELDEELAAHWFIACAGGALVPLLFYPFPPLSAVLPVLPAAALLCGRLLDHLIEDQSRVGALVFRAALMLVVTGSLAAFLLWLVSGRVSQGAHEVRLLATVAFITSWLPFLASMMGRHRLAALFMVLPLGVGAPIAAVRVMPAIDGYLGTHDAAMTANRLMPPRAPLVVFEPPPASLRLELRHNLVDASWIDPALVGARATDGHVYVAFRPGREREIVARLTGATSARLEVLVRTPSIVLARTAG